MTIMRLQADGSYTPDPDEHPTDLVSVRDVYGHRHRIRRAHLDDPGRMLLRTYNQYGQKIRPPRDMAPMLHRDNIAREGGGQ